MKVIVVIMMVMVRGILMQMITTMIMVMALLITVIGGKRMIVGRISSAAVDARRDIAQARGAAAEGGAGALPRVPFPTEPPAVPSVE